MQRIISLVGARPNFMKIAQFVKAIENYNKVNVNKLEHILAKPLQNPPRLVAWKHHFILERAMIIVNG